MSTITETLKAKLDELDLDRRLDELTRATEDAVKKAVAHAGDLAHDNREKVSALLDKASAVIDEKTDGKYRDQVTKAPPGARVLWEGYADACRASPWVVGGHAAEGLRSGIVERGGMVTAADGTELRKGLDRALTQKKRRGNDPG